MPIVFNNRSWTKADDSILEKIVSDKPDVVFLPDDFLYRALAKDIESKTDALVLFVAFFTPKSDLNLSKHQAGVYCDAPVGHLVNTTSRLTEVGSIGLVGGPFANEIAQRIREKVPSNVKVDVTITASWIDYAEALKKYGESHDAIWPLAPFGVKHGDGSAVQEHQLNALISEIKKPSLGYGMISKLDRSLEMEIDPRVLGENAAHALFTYFRTGEKQINEFTSYTIRINHSHIRRLNLTVPDDLSGFLTLRD